MLRTTLRRLTFAVEVSALLYVAASLVGLGLLLRSNSLAAGGLPTNVLSIVGVVAMPALTALAFISLCMLFPGLVAPLKFQFPLQITLPLVFSGLQYMIVNLFVLSDAQVVVMPAPIRTSAAWKEPLVILVALALQIAVSSVGVWMGRRRPNEPGVGE